MPTEAVLIPDPILDDRQERERIAARIHRSIGSLEVADAQLIIEYGESLKAMIEAAGAADDPLLPELTSARPTEAHVVLLTEIERAFTETLYRFNQVPNKVRIALLRLLGVEMLPALAATTTLTFTKSPDFLNQDVVVPAGTLAVSEDRAYRVFTDADLTIAAGNAAASVGATSEVAGDLGGRVPANTIGLLIESIVGVRAVANTAPLAGGRNAETVDQAKLRAREEMRWGFHLGTTGDWEDRIFFRVLRRRGRVTAFEGFYGDFTRAPLGRLLLVVQDEQGEPPSDAALASVGDLIEERHIAGIYVTARAPLYRDFSITARVRVSAGESPEPLIARAVVNLSAYYHPLAFPYGPAFASRAITLSDVIGRIEEAGPRAIDVRRDGGVFDVHIIINGVDYREDVPLNIGELPRLTSVQITT